MLKDQITSKLNGGDPKAETQVILLRPVPLYILLLLTLFFLTVLYFINKPKMRINNSPSVSEISASDPCSKIVRQDDLNLIRPLLFVESCNNEGALSPLKSKITEYINQKMADGTITQGSLYLSSYESGTHIEINQDVLYDPASIMKVPLMLIFLQRAEVDTGFLNTRIFYKEPIMSSTSATIKDRTIVPGRSYSIEELIQFMIIYSDNEAFWLLQQQIPKNEYAKLCKDFDIPLMGDNVNRVNSKQNFVANVNSVSRFFRVLFNASFLSRRMSQYALSILTQSTFKDGIINGVDPNISVAHKFGEREELGECQLHEFGIVYLPGRPYMIGVMTKGKDKNKLPRVISDISKIAYDNLKSGTPN